MSERVQGTFGKDTALARVASVASELCYRIPSVGRWYLGDDVERVRWRATYTSADDVKGWQEAPGDPDATSFRRANWPNFMVISASKDLLKRRVEARSSVFSEEAKPAVAFAMGNAVVAAELPDLPILESESIEAVGESNETRVAMRIGPKTLRASIGAYQPYNNSFRGLVPEEAEWPVPIKELNEAFPDAIRL